MRQYNHITAIPNAFFSRKLYRDVAANWRGFGFWYLFLILLISYLAFCVQVYIGIHKFVITEGPAISSKVPPITITNGVASSPVPQPYVIADPDTGKTFFILDTTGQYTDLGSTEARVLVTDTRLIVRNSPTEIRQYELKSIPITYIDSVKMQHFLEMLGYLLPLALLVFGMIGSMIVWLIAMLIWAAIGLGIASGCGKKITYAQSLRLSAVAMTVPLTVGTILMMSPIPSGCGIWLLLQAGGLLVLWFGINSLDSASSGSWPPGGFPAGGMPPQSFAPQQGFPQQAGFPPAPPLPPP